MILNDLFGDNSNSIRLKMGVKDDTDYQLLQCPVCKWEMVHPIGVSIAPVFGNVQVSVTSEEIKTTSTNLSEKTRGIVISLDFTCEEGHAFTHTFQFHKGGTYILTEQKSEEPENGVIWRD